jgi:Putative prokaryotic signal transducing protein
MRAPGRARSLLRAEPSPRGVPAMPDLVVVRRYRWRHEAEMAQGLLEDAGLEGLVLADDAGGLLGGIGLPLGEPPVRLLVREEDLEVARELLTSETGS